MQERNSLQLRSPVHNQSGKNMWFPTEIRKNDFVSGFDKARGFISSNSLVLFRAQHSITQTDHSIHIIGNLA